MPSQKKHSSKKPVRQAKKIKPDNRRKMIFFSVFIIVILTLIVYYNSLQNSFVTNLDDTTYIANAASMKNLTNDDLSRIFTDIFAGNYHPLAMLSLTLDYHWFGEDAFPFHLISLLFHIANAVLAFWFIYLLLKRIDADEVKRRALCFFLPGLADNLPPVSEI